MRKKDLSISKEIRKILDNADMDDDLSIEIALHQINLLQPIKNNCIAIFPFQPSKIEILFNQKIDLLDWAIGYNYIKLCQGLIEYGYAVPNGDALDRMCNNSEYYYIAKEMLGTRNIDIYKIKQYDEYWSNMKNGWSSSDDINEIVKSIIAKSPKRRVKKVLNIIKSIFFKFTLIITHDHHFILIYLIVLGALIFGTFGLLSIKDSLLDKLQDAISVQ